MKCSFAAPSSLGHPGIASVANSRSTWVQLSRRLWRPDYSAWPPSSCVRSKRTSVDLLTGPVKVLPRSGLTAMTRLVLTLKDASWGFGWICKWIQSLAWRTALSWSCGLRRRISGMARSICCLHQLKYLCRRLEQKCQLIRLIMEIALLSLDLGVILLSLSV